MGCERWFVAAVGSSLAGSFIAHYWQPVGLWVSMAAGFASAFPIMGGVVLGMVAGYKLAQEVRERRD